VKISPWAAPEPNLPLPGPRTTKAMTTTAAAPAIGPTIENQQPLNVFETRSGPNERAGFVDAPEMGLPPQALPLAAAPLIGRARDEVALGVPVEQVVPQAFARARNDLVERAKALEPRWIALERAHPRAVAPEAASTRWSDDGLPTKRGL
jgi:hypothetical protein